MSVRFIDRIRLSKEVFLIVAYFIELSKPPVSITKSDGQSSGFAEHKNTAFNLNKGALFWMIDMLFITEFEKAVDRNIQSICDVKQLVQ